MKPRVSPLDLGVALLGALAVTLAAAATMRLAAMQWTYDWSVIVPLFAGDAVAVGALGFLARPRS